jgi:hypothetical protein
MCGLCLAALAHPSRRKAAVGSRSVRLRYTPLLRGELRFLRFAFNGVRHGICGASGITLIYVTITSIYITVM